MFISMILEFYLFGRKFILIAGGKFCASNLATKSENEPQKKKNIYLRMCKINFGHDKKNLRFAWKVPSVRENRLPQAGKMENFLEAANDGVR